MQAVEYRIEISHVHPSPTAFAARFPEGKYTILLLESGTLALAARCEGRPLAGALAKRLDNLVLTGTLYHRLEAHYGICLLYTSRCV